MYKGKLPGRLSLILVWRLRDSFEITIFPHTWSCIGRCLPNAAVCRTAAMHTEVAYLPCRLRASAAALAAQLCIGITWKFFFKCWRMQHSTDRCSLLLNIATDDPFVSLVYHQDCGIPASPSYYVFHLVWKVVFPLDSYTKEDLRLLSWYDNKMESNSSNISLLILKHNNHNILLRVSKMLTLNYELHNVFPSSYD